MQVELRRRRRKTEEKVDGLCHGGYEGKATMRTCDGQARVEEESEQHQHLTTRDNLNKKKLPKHAFTIYDVSVYIKNK